MTVTDQRQHDDGTDEQVNVVAELLRVVPRFVDRTRSQAELAIALAGRLPCLGTLLGGEAQEDEAAEAEAAGLRETVGVDVLSLLDSGDADAAASAATVDAEPTPTAAMAEPAPAESDLPIEHYDSLAASQVVPRLATMAEPELRAVRSYELANRNRQTILNRIAQRLGD